MDASTHWRQWLRLAHAPQLGALQANELLERFGSARAICEAGRDRLRAAGLAPATVQALHDCGETPDIDDELEWAGRAGNHLLTLHDPRYPALLRTLPDAPPLLRVRGDPEVLCTVQLAMVGSRKPTPLGRRTAFDFARHLAGRGLTITSGLALGIDAASHEGALAGGGLSVAVAGTGADRVYPPEHAALAERLAAEGAIVSEYPPGTAPRRAHFPQRNRIISGLCVGVLVVEAAQRSGSLITARLAGEQGREVFAVPGSIHSPQSRGTNALIRQGAKLVDMADHILEELAPLVAATLRAPAPGAPEPGPPGAGSGPLSAEQRRLLAAVDPAPTSVDTLVERTGHSSAEVASMLLILELQGHVQSLTGGRYLRLPGATDP